VQSLFTDFFGPRFHHFTNWADVAPDLTGPWIGVHLDQHPGKPQRGTMTAVRAADGICWVALYPASNMPLVRPEVPLEARQTGRADHRCDEGSRPLVKSALALRAVRNDLT
jgi:hypothetical protein